MEKAKRVTGQKYKVAWLSSYKKAKSTGGSFITLSEGRIIPKDRGMMWRPQP
jgi:hypothetical protein